ncbi:hypothetical protein Y032_0143g2363 [Ancylostoma ceylanicum]|uniref:Uncharacterized protein n=1 Tax=Ancylostoma ceylanicum TaxID=53326 RepID=A0A016T318_9BILA|nr:hypothetical protein Y032_0143g2363 [Ancylostoma ceylanicum]
MTAFQGAQALSTTYSAFHQGRYLGRQQREKEREKVWSSWRGMREKQGYSTTVAFETDYTRCLQSWNGTVADS